MRFSYFIKSVIFLLTLSGTLSISAQSISISNLGSPPDESAMLDVQSDNKGILVPRINLDNVNNNMLDGVTQAAIGLLIYNSNAAVVGGNGVGYYTFNGSLWEKLITSASGVAIDVDFYEEGTASPPNDINDDLFTLGHLGIGKPIVDYPLDIESGETRGINNVVLGVADDEIIGTYTENANSGLGRHIGSYNSIIGTGSGIQYGSFQLVENSADAAHYGSFNNLIGAGNGPQYGTSQSISNIGTGTHYGTHNILSGNGNGLQYGNYQHISNIGGASHYGSYNLLSGTGFGAQYGSRQEVSTTGLGTHYGVSNLLSGSGNGSQYGSRNEITNDGGGNHYGTSNILTGPGGGLNIGSQQFITNDGSGFHYGSRNTLAGDGEGDQYGTSQTITNKGNGQHFGSYNRLEGDGKGAQYGSYQSIVNIGEGERYGSYNTLTGSSIGNKYGSYQNLTSDAGGRMFGSYNAVEGMSDSNHSGTENVINNDGDGNHFGTVNRLAGEGNGDQFGSYSVMTNLGTGNKYGTYNVISQALPGRHYGVYSWVTKDESFAGYFKGNVYIGDVDAANSARPKFQVTGGFDASYNDGSGYLTLGLQNGNNVVYDNNEILARNNGNASPLYIQRDGGNLLLSGDEMGAVGIGISSDANMPAGFLLAVDGRIISEEIQVELSGSWPDYVFMDSYELKTLDELEHDIDDLGHLPGMPSAELVQEEGFALGDMQKKLLEKIEELTLYVIAGNKKMEAMETENKELNERIKNLEFLKH